MKYTDSKNNIQFNKVQQPGVYHASGPIGLNGRYSTNGNIITDISSEMHLINAIDINWNGARVEPDIELNTTGDLLRWIKSKSSSGETIDININSDGYWCINGRSLGVKARGENGLTPYIGSNGNWWIGTDDLGIPAYSTGILESNVSYTSNYINSPTTYQLGILKVGTKEFPIIGKNVAEGSEGSSQVEIAYIPTITSNTSNSYEIGKLLIGDSLISIYGKDTYSSGGNVEPLQLITEPLVSINELNRNPSNDKSFLYYNNNVWEYITLTDLASSIHGYLTENNYYNSIGSLVSISNLRGEGISIATITIDNIPYDIKAPVGEGGDITIEGDTVRATSEYNSGKKLATISINNEPTYIYMPSLSYDELDNKPTIPDAYDDSDITDAIASLNEGIDALNELESTLESNLEQLLSDLDGILDTKRQDIIDMVNDVLNGKNFVEGWLADWIPEILTYLISVGLLEEGEDGITFKKNWAYLEVRCNEIDASVLSLERIIGDNGEINLEALKSELKLYTDDKVGAAIAELTANYGLTDEDKTVIKWLSSGLYAEASANKALAQVFATAEQYNTLSNLLTQTLSGVSGLTTEVTNIKNNYVARTSLGSMVKEVIRDNEGNALSLIISSSGLVTLNDINSAVSSLSSSISNTYATKSELGNYATTSALAGVSNEVTNIENNYVAKASLGSLVKNEIRDNDEIVAQIKSRTGLVTQADINSATSTLASQISTDYATKSALNTTNTNVSNVSSALATVQTKVTNLENAGYLATASFGTVLKLKLNDSDIKEAVIAAAGVVSESTIDSKITSAKNTIFALVDGTYAKISTTVTKDSNGIISNASINANNINLDSSHLLKITAANQLNITASVLKSIINDATVDIIGSATINANLLNLTANDILAKLGNASIAANKIDFSTGTYTIAASHLNLTASDILAKLGNASISADKINFNTGSYTIDASHINLNGTVLFNYIGDEFENKGIKIDNDEINIGWYAEGDHKNLILNKDYVTLISEMDYRDRVYIESNHILVEAYNESYPTNIYAGRIRTGTFEAIEDVIVNNELSFIPSGYNTASAHIYAVLGGLQIDSSETIGMDGNVSISGDFTVYGDITGNSITSPSFVVKDASGSSENAMITYSASPDHSIEMDSALTVFGDVYVEDNCDLTVEGTIYCSSGVQSSDERIKENIVNVDANIEDIASTRIVTFNFKDKEERNLGTIAQDWQNIFPNAVKENKKGYLGIDYGAIALGSAVTAAREIVTLKEKVLTLEEENQSLKERLAAVEATLERINTALG